MPTLVEMATELVAARARSTPMTADDVVAELRRYYAELKNLEAGQIGEETAAEPPQPAAPTLSIKDAFKKNEVVCMICGKGGFKTLSRHLTTAHGMKPGEYKKQFGIPAKASLSAKSYSETRRKMAQDRGLAQNLAKAREVRQARMAAQGAAEKPADAAEPKTKAPRKPRKAAAAKAE